MDNATDALKMAGSVLLFVLALTVAINAFGLARQTADIVLSFKDRETEYIDTDNYYKADDNNKNRKVGLETVIPAIYRSFKENYRIVFIKSDGTNYDLYKATIQDKSEEHHEKEVTFNYLDLYDTAIPKGNEKEFIVGILYRQDLTTKTAFDSDLTLKTKFMEKYKINEFIGGSSLYDILKGANSITEEIGVYYQEDLDTTSRDSVPESNKDEKRIITYTIKE